MDLTPNSKGYTIASCIAIIGSKFQSISDITEPVLKVTGGVISIECPEQCWGCQLFKA